MKVKPVNGRRAQQKQYPLGRICESDGCDTRLSRYNDDTICAPCYEKISIDKLPTTVGQYL